MLAIRKKVFSLLKNLLGRDTLVTLPSSVSDFQLASDFSQFFQSKIFLIREELDSIPVQDEFSVDLHPQHPSVSLLLKFRRVDEANIQRGQFC